MAAVRQVQRLYHVAWKDTGEIAEELGIPEARVSRYVRYNTHFLGVHDLVSEGYDGDPYERLMPGMLSVSAERGRVPQGLHRAPPGAVRHPAEEGQGHPRQRPAACSDTREAALKEIGMYHMMKESAVEKAKNRAGREAERSLSRQQAPSVEGCSSHDAAAGPAAGGGQ